MSTPSVLAFAAGLGAGVKVTRDLHGDPDAGRWGERLGSSRLRYANLPVGGTIAIGISPLLPDGVARLMRALGTGALIGAVGWGVVDPLAPLVAVPSSEPHIASG